MSAKCSVPGKRCCTYDFTLAEYKTLCGVQYGSNGPHLQAFGWNASNPSACSATPNVLADMGAFVIGAGAALVPEQKYCDLMCVSPEQEPSWES